MIFLAPNSYKIPSLMGPVVEGGKASSPAFTMSGRARDMDDKMKVFMPLAVKTQIENLRTRSKVGIIGFHVNPIVWSQEDIQATVVSWKFNDVTFPFPIVT